MRFTKMEITRRPRNCFAQWPRKVTHARNNLGTMYFNGDGVLRDYSEAVKWLRLAAGQGNVRAQTTLGVMYMKGFGLAQSYFDAVKWYRLAADQGFPEAQVPSRVGRLIQNVRPERLRTACELAG